MAEETGPDPADVDPPARDLRAEAREKVARERDEARAAVARQREEAKQTARRAKQEARSERAAIRSARRDHIVEAPREPKAPITQRLRGAGKGGSERTAGARRKRVLSILAAVLGAVGLICSVVLAVGALLVALGTDDGTFYDTAARICDALVGPLRDAFSFSGTNADMKESLVAWGAGSIAYLVVGLVAQSLLRAVADD